MSLTALGGMPLVQIGSPSRSGIISGGAFSATLLDATSEACIMYGRVFTEDGGSHTIDTTGSSSLGWRTTTVSATWNAGTILKVGLAALDTANGPPARATNAANVITFDVNGQYITGAAPTSAAWNETIPTTGTKTIANGDLVAFCVQMVTQGGTDSCNVATPAIAGTNLFPNVTAFTGGTYSTAGRHPVVVITFSDGKYGFFEGGFVASIGTSTQTFNNASSPNEYGNFFQFPVPVKIYGIITNSAIAADFDVVLYSDPLGTPNAEKTVSFDLNVAPSTTSGQNYALFPSPYTTTANQPLAGILKPTSVTNITTTYLTLDSANHQKAWHLGTNCYAVNRSSGAFAAQNANKDRYFLGLLVGAFDDGAGGGSGGGMRLAGRGGLASGA